MAWLWDRLFDLLWKIFSYHFVKLNGLNSAQRNLNQFVTEDMLTFFILIESAEHLSKFRDYCNTCNPDMSFSFEQEKNGKFSFLDVEVSRGKVKFVATVYRSLLLVVNTSILNNYCQQ